MLLALMVFIVLSILGLTAITISAADNRHSIHQYKKTQAYYLARAGAEAVGKYIVGQSNLLNKTELNEFVDNIKEIPSEEVRLDDADPGYFIVRIAETPQGLDVISTGFVDKVKETATLSLKKVTRSFITNLDKALYASEKIQFEGSTRIYGSVETDFTDPLQISFNNSGGQFIDGDVLVTGSSISKDNIYYGEKIKGNVIPLETSSSPHTLPDFPAYPDDLPVIENEFVAGWNPSPPYTIKESGWYQDGITVQSTLNMEIGDDDLVIRTKYLRVTGAGQINVIRNGNGILYIFIDGTGDRDFVLENSGSINKDGDPDDVLVYFKASEFKPSGAAKMNASIYGQSANIHIANSGYMNGHIVTGGDEVRIDGDAGAFVRVLYAPEASVTIEGSGKVEGIIVAKELKITGNSYIKYEPVPEDDESIEEIFGSKELYVYDIWK